MQEYQKKIKFLGEEQKEIEHLKALEEEKEVKEEKKLSPIDKIRKKYQYLCCW